jgi:hypothetical protein
MLESTSKFEVKAILYNDGEFAIAEGYWNKEPTLRLATRWHEDGGIGYPQTYGKPQWFLFPVDFGKTIRTTMTIINLVKEMHEA